SCKTGLPTPIPYKRPSSGRSHRTTKPPSPASQTNNARHPPSFIPGTNAIESLNARYRRAVKARGHFPTEQAALKCLYLVTRSLDPTGAGRTRWTMRWKPALNAFAITFSDRFPAAENY
ncbi:transposase, partial [Arthrobacter sp. 2MCAF14]|uniref:transposase n=1 Tax=Arthrobacter sp. 2MCAF14 TaxID=3232982 RepID=UPI003F923E8A